MPPLPPHGPYAEAVPDGDRWRVVLTAEGQALVAAFLEKYPKPAVCLRFSAPALYASLRDRGAFADPGHEVHGDAVTGAVRAATRYDPAHAKAAKFERYAFRVAGREILAARRRKLPPEASPLAECEQPGAGRGVEAVDAADECGAVLARLKPRQRLVLTLRGGLADGRPRTLAEVGAALGVTRQYVEQIEKAAVKAARELAVTS